MFFSSSCVPPWKKIKKSKEVVVSLLFFYWVCFLLVGLPSDALQGFADVFYTIKTEYGFHAAVAAPLGTMPFTDAHAVAAKLCIRVVDSVLFVAHLDLTDECTHLVEGVAEHICCVFADHPRLALEHDDADAPVGAVREGLDLVVVVLHGDILLFVFLFCLY